MPSGVYEHPKGKNHPQWKGGKVKKICQVCGKEFYVILSRKNTAKYCSHKCKGFVVFQKTQFKPGRIPWIKGKHHSIKTKQKMSKAQWKGGIILHEGYIFIYKRNHPFCNSSGYIKRSRLEMEKYLERYLTKEEVIHHKGIKYPISSIENRQDDRIENLKLFENNSAHIKFHYKLRPLLNGKFIPKAKPKIYNPNQIA